MSVSKMKIAGTMFLRLEKANGEVIERVKDNLVTSVGFDFVADCLANGASRPAVLSHIAVGTDNTATASNMTALVAELAREAATYAHSAGSQQFTMQANFPAGVATGTLREAGVFNDAGAGIMLDRVTFGDITKEASDSLLMTFLFQMN